MCLYVLSVLKQETDTHQTNKYFSSHYLYRLYVLLINCASALPIEDVSEVKSLNFPNVE